jgi:putative addiction module killer protein
MTKHFEIAIYKISLGKEPYTEWEESLDRPILARIDARLTRIRETGILGVCEPVGDGVFELKFDFGPGYRIYFGYQTNSFLIFLLGGCKKTQQRDINKAIKYWRDHLSTGG